MSYTMRGKQTAPPYAILYWYPAAPDPTGALAPDPVDWAVCLGSTPAVSGGASILHGSGVPDPGTGNNDDFYIDTDIDMLYGPKTGGAWGAGTSMVGANITYTTLSASGSGTYQHWTRPTGHRMMTILCLGSGGAGGKGYSAAGGSAKFGGGGGGGGGCMRWVGPALWADLYVVVGVGGQPTAGAGGDGEFSYVSTSGASVAYNLLVAKSGNTVAKGGSAGTGSTGTNGAGSTVSTGGALSGYGSANFVAGVNGTSGSGTATPPTDISPQGTLAISTGGGGGGGAATTGDASAGAAIGGGTWSYQAGGTAAPGAAGGAGTQGYLTTLDYGNIMSTGGCGGGGSVGDVGGAGGLGRTGSGGGGGGAGTTGGDGAAGGDGLVVILSW